MKWSSTWQKGGERGVGGSDESDEPSNPNLAPSRHHASLREALECFAVSYRRFEAQLCEAHALPRARRRLSSSSRAALLLGLSPLVQGHKPCCSWDPPGPGVRLHFTCS